MSMLILVTVSMGILDSFNPVALTQQFLLQGMVKKRRHILLFPLSVGVTNLVGGLLIYYGLARAMTAYWETLMNQYFWVIPACEIIVGILAWTYVAFRRVNKKFSELYGHLADSHQSEADREVCKPKSVHPAAIAALGAFAVLCEIPTSLPYFAFIAMLLSHELALPALLGILALYNLLFTLPLYAMYLLYIRCRRQVDRLYLFLKNKLFRYGTILLPVLAAIIGIAAILHACFLLFTR
ncbi:GAP family protein [Ruminococcaceae bacterium OttesenSCG-928-L11]|nr:GAP family protein [Ruminococcaceae bacterium OttesenSCG-928-L11]